MSDKQLESRESAITLWQLGEWQALSESSIDDPVFSAITQLESGDLDDFISGATDKSEIDGLKKLVLSSLYNSLGRSALLFKRKDEALQLFKDALSTGPFPGKPEMLAPLRLVHQESQLGIQTTTIDIHSEQKSSPFVSQPPHISQLYTFLDSLLQQLSLYGKNFVLDGVRLFQVQDPFLAGKLVSALAYWVTEYPPGSYPTRDRIKKAREIFELLRNEVSSSWGTYFYLKGLFVLVEAGLLEPCISFDHLIHLKETLHYSEFINTETWELVNKPTNFYQVAYAIAHLRFLLGWETADASYSLLNRMQEHFSNVKGEQGFADETGGKGRYDRYSILFVAEIAHRMREAGLPLPAGLRESLRKSADYVLINLNEQGDGFQYGRSIGAYGDTAFIEILSAAAWFGLLSDQEMKVAHFFTGLVTDKFCTYWWDENRGSVNLWEDGRTTDAYRSKNRILGENFSLLHHHIYVHEVWRELGFTEPQITSTDFSDWLQGLPAATLTWFHYDEHEKDEFAIFTWRDGQVICNLPMVNGEKYYNHSSYLPVPYTSTGIQGIPDTVVPLLVPKIICTDTTELWPVSNFRNITLDHHNDVHILSYSHEYLVEGGHREPKPNNTLQLSTEYRFSPESIERTDSITGDISIIEQIQLEWPNCPAIETCNREEKICFFRGSPLKHIRFTGFQEVSNNILATYIPDKTKELQAIELGWQIGYVNNGESEQ